MRRSRRYVTYDQEREKSKEKQIWRELIYLHLSDRDIKIIMINTLKKSV